MTDAPDAGPLHGFRGAPPDAPMTRPKSFTVAISREAGSRDSGVAEALGRVLGWPVFPQDMLDFLAREDEARADILRDLPAGAIDWAATECEKLVQARRLDPAGDTAAVARLVFSLAARGEAILVGRGAGFLLPRDSTVHVRVVAGLPERVAYLAQSMRLGETEAAEEARRRDETRKQFLGTLTDAAIDSPTNYDLVVNSGRVGLETAAELIAALLRGRQLPAPAVEEWGVA